MQVTRRGPRLALTSFLRWMVVIALVVISTGCRGRERKTGLVPPSDAREWEDRFGVAFDDLFTLAPVPLDGRAVHDVTDQRLFQARMGHADLILRARVENTWSRRRYDGELEQIVELTITETLVGKLPKRASKAQSVSVRNADPLELMTEEGAEVIWFLRWAPRDNPPFHHHLVPAAGGALDLATAMALANSPKGKGRRGPDGQRRKRERPKSGSGPDSKGEKRRAKSKEKQESARPGA